MNIFFLGVGLIVVASGFGAGPIQHTVDGHTHTAVRFRDTRIRALNDRVWHRPDDRAYTSANLSQAKMILENNGVSYTRGSFYIPPAEQKQLIKALCIVAMCGVEPSDICYKIRWPLAQKKLHNEGVTAAQLEELENLLNKVRNFSYSYDAKEVCDSIADKVAEYCVSISDGIVQPYSAEEIWNEKIQPMLNGAR